MFQPGVKHIAEWVMQAGEFINFILIIFPVQLAFFNPDKLVKIVIYGINLLYPLFIAEAS